MEKDSTRSISSGGLHSWCKCFPRAIITSPGWDVSRLGKDYWWEKYSTLPLALGLWFFLQACSWKCFPLNFLQTCTLYMGGMTGQPVWSCSAAFPHLAAGSHLRVRQHCRQPARSLPAFSTSPPHSLTLRFHPHTLLLMVRGRDRVHHAFTEAISSWSHQVLNSEPGDEQIPQAAPALCLGLKQSRRQLWCGGLPALLHRLCIPR